MIEKFDTGIHTIIPVPDWKPDEASLLQGFSYSLCRNAHLIRIPIWMPSDIFDLSPVGRDTKLARRICQIDQISYHPQSPRAFMSLPVLMQAPFVVVCVGKGDDPEPYMKWAQSSAIPPTVLAEAGGHLTYRDLTLASLKERLLLACDALAGDVEAKWLEQVRSAISQWEEPPSKTLNFKVGGHGSIAPNIAALSALGYDGLVEGPFRVSAEQQPYIDQVVQTTKAVLAERALVPTNGLEDTCLRSPGLNLYAPAMYPAVGQFPTDPNWNSEERKRFRSAIEILTRQTGYSFELRTEAQRAAVGLDAAAPPIMETPPKPHPIMLIRQQEIALGTEAVSALAASDISATIRLPNDVNRTLGAVRQFASHYRGRRATPRKRRDEFKRIQTRLAQSIPPEFLEIIGRCEEDIRIISDAHLEWLDCQGIPLGLRKNVSRIPVTPGNLFIEQMGSKPLMRLMHDDFRHVLIVSALKEDDPIKPFFKIAFETFSEQWGDAINVSHVQVSTTDEFVRVVNEFEGPLLMFDGHGSHEANKPGMLHFEDESCDVWTLRDRIERIPPVVILSACDTHAADRNHATTANGFLSLGARTVLGSVLPLDGRDAAIFAARLVYRIADYIPRAVATFGRALSWTEIVMGMLRMQLLTDFLHLLLKKNLISDDVYREIHYLGNMAINTGAPDPFEDVMSALTEKGVPEETLRIDFGMALANSSVLAYINVGRPETIMVDVRERFDSAFALAQQRQAAS